MDHTHIYIYITYIYITYISMVCAVAIAVESSFLLISHLQTKPRNELLSSLQTGLTQFADWIPVCKPDLCGIQSTNWTLKTSIDPRDRPCRIHPASEVCPACPGAPDPFRTPSTIYHSSAPLLPPPSLYPYLPCVRLHCTMPCYGTPRVRVLECPPLGRPSLIK